MSKRDRIDRHVEERSAALGGIHPPAHRIGVGEELELGRDGCQPADAAAGDPGSHLIPEGQETHPHRLHEEDTVGPGVIDHAPGLSGVEGNRFLAEDRYPDVDEGHRVMEVTLVRRSDVGDVDIPRQVGWMFESKIDAVPITERVRPSGGGRHNRHHLGVRHRLQSLGHCPGDIAGPDDAPFEDHGCDVRGVSLHVIRVRVGRDETAAESSFNVERTT